MKRNEELFQKFGERVCAYRKKKGFTVAELAAAAGLEPSQIQKIETGKLNFHLSTIVALALALGISPAELLKGL